MFFHSNQLVVDNDDFRRRDGNGRRRWHRVGGNEAGVRAECEQPLFHGFKGWVEPQRIRVIKAAQPVETAAQEIWRVTERLVISAD